MVFGQILQGDVPTWSQLLSREVPVETLNIDNNPRFVYSLRLPAYAQHQAVEPRHLEMIAPCLSPMGPGGREMRGREVRGLGSPSLHRQVESGRKMDFYLSASTGLECGLQAWVRLTQPC